MKRNYWYELIIDGYRWYTNQRYYDQHFKIAETLGGELTLPNLTTNQVYQIKDQLNDFQKLGFNSKIIHLNRNGIHLI